MAEAPQVVQLITPAIRVVTTDKEWIVQTLGNRRARCGGARHIGVWTDRAYMTGKGMLGRELRRLVDNGALEDGLKPHVDKDVIQWLNRLPNRHPARHRK
jgi:hypothetical protein